MNNREHWEKRVDLCKDAKQQMKNKWLTASGVRNYLRHLPEYEDISISCPKEYEIVLNTILELYEYSEKMFNITRNEMIEGFTNCKESYLSAMAINNQSFIGAICGDIIGSAYEFHPTKDPNFKLFTPRTTFTDDTVMTCAVAEWLISDPKHSHRELIKIMHRYGDEYPHRGYGGMFGRWLEGHLTEPYNSFGNGSAMRVSPVGYYAKSLEEALQLAQISAEVTHSHPEGIKGAQAVAAITYIMKTSSINNNVDNALEKVKKFIKEHYSYKIEYTEEEWDEHSAKYSFNETCQGSVPEAIYCALSSDNYEQAIRKAIALGGDADTQAAIAGGIASAYCPVSLEIISKCLELLPDDLVMLIKNFNRTVITKEMTK